MTNKAFLIILDGWGHCTDDSVSAIAQADTPYVDSLYQKYPHAELVTYGREVGLPKGQMGNSEVGHLNIGAGRIVYQALARINKAIEDGSLFTNPVVLEAVQKAKSGSKPIHLMGLMSDGGVHAHIDHIISLAKFFSEYGVKVYIHAFMDGRDTGSRSGKDFVASLLKQIDGTDVELSSLVGRYYAMDRDNRWDRIQKAYEVLVHGKGDVTNDPLESIQSQYDQDVTDEFLEPIKVGSESEGTIQKDDVVFFANFRTDRPRQLTTALTQQKNGSMMPISCHFVTFTEYDAAFKGINVVFAKDKISNTIGEVVANKGLSQLRIAETEKYPHVSFFLNGGREEPYQNEKRIVVDSPKVATYDMQPEMSAYEVTNEVDSYIIESHPDLIVLNYANADMIGHTGDIGAAIIAVETLDSCLEALVPRALNKGYKIVIIADHGNSDIMLHPDGSPHTAHTLNKVPVIVLDQNSDISEIKDGKLADVAPTLLKLMNIDQPIEMEGKSLI